MQIKVKKKPALHPAKMVKPFGLVLCRLYQRFVLLPQAASTVR
jgi:hypothetical protein